MVNLNIEKEKKFLELLGLFVSGPDNLNSFIISDENGQKIGTIEYKKSKYLEDYYEYYTEIINDNIKVKSGVLDRFEFPSFLIHMKNLANTQIHIGSCLTAIDVHSASNYRLILRIYPDRIYFEFNFQSPYNFHEVIDVDLSEKKYIYEVCYTDPKGNTDNYEYRKGILECKSYLGNPNSIEIKNTWTTQYDCKESTKQYISKVEGTIGEAIKKHRTGIDSFNCFRGYLNNLLPFTEDVISFLVENSEFELPELLELFIPDIKNYNKNQKHVKQKKKQKNGNTKLD